MRPTSDYEPCHSRLARSFFAFHDATKHQPALVATQLYSNNSSTLSTSAVFLCASLKSPKLGKGTLVPTLPPSRPPQKPITCCLAARMPMRTAGERVKRSQVGHDCGTTAKVPEARSELRIWDGKNTLMREQARRGKDETYGDGASALRGPRKIELALCFVAPFRSFFRHTLVLSQVRDRDVRVIRAVHGESSLREVYGLQRAGQYGPCSHCCASIQDEKIR